MLPEKEIEKTKQDLVDLHKRVLTDYLIREGLSYKGRTKFFHIYDHYINRRNIEQYFQAPCYIFVKALIRNKLDLIHYVGPIPESHKKKHRRKKSKKTVSF